MRYQEPSFVSRDATVETVRVGSTNQVCDALIGASLFTDEPAWIEVLCLDLARTRDDHAVRAAAILGLAHLARRFGELQDVAEVMARLEELSETPELAGRVEDVRDDLRAFIVN